MFKVITNPDKDFYKKITQAVKDNNNYCPCLIDMNEDTLCMCKDFREQNNEGFCHCKRFKKVLR